jgi:hypothetical protein
MREICTSGSMSGEGKRDVAAWPKSPRPSSTLPLRLDAGYGRFANDGGYSLSIAPATASRAVAASMPCCPSKSAQSATIASASCMIFRRLK